MHKLYAREVLLTTLLETYREDLDISMAEETPDEMEHNPTWHQVVWIQRQLDDIRAKMNEVGTCSYGQEARTYHKEP